MGEVLAGLFDAAISYTHGGGLSGAAWSLAGSFGGDISSVVSYAAEAHSLYTTFNHGNFFTDLRDYGENYLVASATEASVNGVDAAAKGSTFKNGFTTSVRQQVGRLEGAVADTLHLIATGKFQTTMVFMGRPTVVGYEDVDYGLEPGPAAPEHFSAEELAANERVVAAERRIYDLEHPSAAAAVYGGFARYRGAFAAGEWISDKVAQATVMALGGIEDPAVFGELEFEEVEADTAALESRGYDRLEIEVKSGRSVSAEDATSEWDAHLGPDQTNIDPRDGLPDPDRIWSADGTRSIRFGNHEMNSSFTKFHYHEEFWFDDHVVNVLQRVRQ